ncbi:flavin reductase family protein [Dactylosporangium sp. NPDC051485]|uniref:flavin reductase family protein n=1 Tax=Dactylosporangium sp. NPDC051485 TaxID=3154846 RepID=UPI00343B3650
MSDQQQATPASLRDVMSRFATGVMLLTVGGEHIHGMTANAFSSVSLEPSLVLCCVAHSAVMHRSISAERRFAMSIMAADQEALARYFADKSRPLGPSQFAAVDWYPGPLSGAPLLAGALAWLECEIIEAHDSGDHSIFIGSVLSSLTGPAGEGLIFYGGKFRPGAAKPAAPGVRITR